MARTDLSVQSIVAAGLAPSFAAANVDGHSIPGDGDTFVEVKNAGGAPITVTVRTPLQQGGLDVAEQTISIPATTGDKIIGRFRPDIYNQAADGKVYLDFSSVTSVTVAAFKLG